MNKYILPAIIIVLLLGGVMWIASSQSTPTTTTSETNPTEVMIDDSIENDTTGIMEDTETMMEDNPLAEDEMVFELTGKKFEFSTTELRVNQGDTVTIKFTSEDGLHDWVVDEFNARTEQVDTGGSTEVTFVADRVGTFEYYCSVGNHRQMGMIGTLVVE